MEAKNEFISEISKRINADPEMVKKVRFLQKLILKDRQSGDKFAKLGVKRSGSAAVQPGAAPIR